MGDALDGPEGEARRVAHAEWGLTLAAETAGGWTCDVGIRIDDGLLRVQAYALEAQEGIDPSVLLQWNRQTRLVRMALTQSGDVWVLGDVPVQAVDEREVDRLLGLVVEGVLAVRGYARQAEQTRCGWLSAP